jgi:hypothetical protein
VFAVCIDAASAHITLDGDVELSMHTGDATEHQDMFDCKGKQQ